MRIGKKKTLSITVIVGLFLVIGSIPAMTGIKINKENLNTQPPHPPIANFFWTPEDPNVGEQIIFNASESFAFHDCWIVSYDWDLDEDNECDDACGMITECCHNVQDVYDITLRVTDNEDRIGQVTKSIDFRNPPITPVINGEPTIKINKPYTCEIMTEDPDEDNVYYKIDWGPKTTEWLGPYNSGETITKDYTFGFTGDVTIKVKAKDTTDAESDWGTIGISVAHQLNQIKLSKYNIIDFISDYLNKFFIF